jgi:MFS family permease
MSPVERRAALSLAGVYFLRMFGLFLILPVFALYAEDLAGATATLAGIAIGIYGLTQAALQIPFGLLSDRIGRKPVILGGLALFALGSVVAALADHILGVIIGRALQGSGAIAAAIMALNADLTREENRTKAMALVGMSIGLAFFLALLAGPLLAAWIGVPGMFWLTAVLALAGMALIHVVVPTPARSRVHRDAEPVVAQLGTVARDPELARLDFGIFTLHAILTAMFVVLPLVLRDGAGLVGARHWQLYLPVLVCSVAAMVPFVIMAERRQRMKPVFVGAVLAVGLAQLALWGQHGSVLTIGLWLWVFFTGFNILEASLPALISRVAPPDRKGSAMGIYSSMQFLGAFVGGAVGGYLHEHNGPVGVFAFTAVAALGWTLVAAGMRTPKHLSSLLLHVGALGEDEARDLSQRLAGIPGVAEAVVLGEDGVAYLKVNRRELDEDALRAYSVAKG